MATSNRPPPRSLPAAGAIRSHPRPESKHLGRQLERRGILVRDADSSGITVNLTVIKAGDRSNIIPDLAEATLDVRFRKIEDFYAVLAKIKSGLATAIVPDSTITVTEDGSTYPPLTENPQIDALGARAQAIYAELGKKLALSGNGGASESAVAMSVGTPALDGLGYVGSAFHTDHEWIELSSVTPRLYLFTRLLMETSLAPPKRSVAP